MRWIVQLDAFTCKMVAAANAAIWWGKKVPRQGSPEWERWIDRCKAREGPSLNVEILYWELGLAAIPIVPRADAAQKALDQGVPVNVSIWHNAVGLHSVLALPGGKNPLVLGMPRHGKPKYMNKRMPLERLFSYCFQEGNPNRSVKAIVPSKKILEGR